jgi:hypothetical protein
MFRVGAPGSLEEEADGPVAGDLFQGQAAEESVLG